MAKQKKRLQSSNQEIRIVLFLALGLIILIVLVNLAQLYQKKKIASQRQESTAQLAPSPALDQQNQNYPTTKIEGADQNEDYREYHLRDVIMNIPIQYLDAGVTGVLAIQVETSPSTQSGGYISHSVVEKVLVTIQREPYYLSFEGSGHVDCPSGSFRDDTCSGNLEKLSDGTELMVWKDINDEAFLLTTSQQEIGWYQGTYTADVVAVRKNEGSRFSSQEVEMWKQILLSARVEG